MGKETKPMRSELRITDLKRRVPTTTRLINMRIPSRIGAEIDRLADKLGASKTEVVIALLNAGLDKAATKVSGLPTRPKRR
jgi:hypothetical protein